MTNEEIKNLNNKVYSSNTNFLLIKTDRPEISTKLKDIGLLVSDLSGQLEPGTIRVSVGTHKENEVFISAYKKILKDK